ncbi:hypothetical protein HNQ56_003645 [Anaerotaenia torta]|uniref:hypothetical protein n=1 Tax=Anaerotaenia torta TaxID=433293 RepID=UPI003D1F6AFF
MSTYKRRSEFAASIAVLLSVAISAHLMLVPLADVRRSDSKAAKHTSLSLQYENVLLTNEVNKLRMSGNAGISPPIYKDLGEFQRLLQRLLDVSLIPAVTGIILLSYGLTFYRNTRRRKSLLAISLGGHAPPAAF